MILLDSNIWLALTISTHSHHQVARDWMEKQYLPKSVWFCPSTHQSFLRLLTNASVLKLYGLEALTNSQAWDAFDRILSDDRIGLISEEPPGLLASWRHFSARPSPSPKLWMDAYLAAFCVSGGFSMVTTDRAFRQFEGLRLTLLD